MNTIYQLKFLDRSKGSFVNKSFDEAVIGAMQKFVSDKETSAVFASFWYHYDTLYFFGMDASAMQHKIIQMSIQLGIRLYAALQKIPAIEMSFSSFENPKALQDMCKARAEVLYEAYIDGLDKRSLFGEDFVLPFTKLPEHLQSGMLIVSSTADKSKYSAVLDEETLKKIFVHQPA